MFGRVAVVVQVFAILLLANVADAADVKSDASDEKLDVFKESTMIRMEALKDSLRKDVESVLLRFDAQDKRVEAQNSKIDQGLSLLGTMLSGLGIVLTVFGVLSFFSVQAKAKKEAGRVAVEWFEENSESFKSKIVSLQERLAELEAQAKDSFEKHILLVETGAKNARQKMQTSIDNTASSPHVAFQSALALAEVAQAAINKPEQEYSFMDVNNLAFNYYSEGDYVNAVKYWGKAVNHKAATIDQIAESLFNLGVMYKNLGQLRKAISIYDEVIAKFSESSSRFARLQAAKSMINRAGDLSLFGESAEVKGGYLEFFEWEKRHAQDALESQVSKANNGLGYQLLCEAKQMWANIGSRNENLIGARRYFEDAIAIDPENSFAIGNLAYCSHLMGASEAESHEKIREALVIGGEHLYKSTLKDFLINPVPLVDDRFEEILKTEWVKLSKGQMG